MWNERPLAKKGNPYILWSYQLDELLRWLYNLGVGFFRRDTIIGSYVNWYVIVKDQTIFVLVHPSLS